MTSCPKCGTTLSAEIAASILGSRKRPGAKGVPAPTRGNRNKWLACPYCPPGSRKWQNALKRETHINQCHPYDTLVWGLGR